MRYLSIALTTAPDGRWHPGIGDPSVLGWLTVAAYLGATFFAYQALLQTRKDVDAFAKEPAGAADQRRLAIIWGLIAVVMLLLGINKQLDLQTFFTQTLRDMAISGGWYERRRTYQAGAIAALCIGGGCAIAAAAFFVRGVFRRAAGAIIGLALIVVFVMIRAASFHHIDTLLFRGSVRLNWVLELGAIGVVTWSAYLNGYALRRRGRRRGND